MSIKHRLNLVIKSINEFSHRTNVVAINTAIHASKLETHQSAPFKVLVKEIQNMSSQSIDKLSELDELINEITALSSLINMTGSQRMLLFKIVNAHMLEDQQLLEESSLLFTNQLTEISTSKINSKDSLAILDQIEHKWTDFKMKLNDSSPVSNYQRANQIIVSINSLIKQYERHAGQS